MDKGYVDWRIIRNFGNGMIYLDVVTTCENLDSIVCFNVLFWNQHIQNRILKWFDFHMFRKSTFPMENFYRNKLGPKSYAEPLQKCWKKLKTSTFFYRLKYNIDSIFFTLCALWTVNSEQLICESHRNSVFS